MTGLDVVAEFLNTVDLRTFRRHGEGHVGGERLTSPTVLAGWLRTHDLSAGKARLRPDDVAATVDLRTSIRDSLGAPQLSASAFAAYPMLLVPDASAGLRLAVQSNRPWLNAIVETMTESVARGSWSRLKLCAAPDCRWAFFDTSRSGRGRWCEMAACGNRHKTRAYRERRQVSVPVAARIG